MNLLDLSIEARIVLRKIDTGIDPIALTPEDEENGIQIPQGNGISQADENKGIAELLQKGWIEPKGKKMALTPEAQKFLEIAKAPSSLTN